MKFLGFLFVIFVGVFSSHFALGGSAESSESTKSMYGSEIRSMRMVGGTDLRMVESDTGVFFISSNGRYSLKGRLFDNWRGHWVKSVDMLKDTELVSLGDLNIDKNDLAMLSAGKGDKEVDIFVDPLCPYCRTFISNSVGLMDEYRFNFILVSFVAKESARAVQTLWCAEDSGAALLALANKSWLGLKQRADCDMTNIQKNMFLSKMIGVPAVPYAIRWDGKKVQGNPEDLKGWLIDQEDIKPVSLEQVLAEESK